MALEIYRKKRKFDVTSEPRGRKVTRRGNDYVIQKHAARRLHYDLRLELAGVMKSWAVTRGPSLDPAEKRLAVHVEDHPIEYNTFEGTIPQGEYGGGTVMIWDRGRWFPEGDPHKGYAKGHLEFTLDGEKLHGRWHLVRMRTRDKDRHENWLLIKGKDEDARERTQRRYFGGRAVVGGERPLDGGDRRGQGQEAGLAQQSPCRGAVRCSSGANPTRIQGSVAGGSRVAGKEKFQIAKQDDGQAAKKSAAKATTKQKREPKRPPPAAAARRSSAKPAVAAAARKRSASPPRGGRGSRLPDFVPPSLATLHDTAPSGPQWIHEIKFDGYRIQASSIRVSIAARSSCLPANSSIGRIASSALPRRSPRFPRRRRSSTANWSSRTTRACRVSRCCRTT